MDTVNGKPTGSMVSLGAKSKGGHSGYGVDTVNLTFGELEALWKKVQNNRK